MMRLKFWLCIGLVSWITVGSVWGQEKSKTPAFPRFEADTLELQFGGAFESVGGNIFKYQQYGTPQEGPILQRLWLMGGRPGMETYAVDFYQPGATDNKLNLNLYSTGPVARYRFFYNTWREHPELNDLRVIRKHLGMSADVPLQWHGLSLLGYLEDRVFSPAVGKVFPQHPTTLYPDFRLKSGGLGLVIPYGPAELSLRGDVTEFTDKSNYQPSNITHENSAELRADIATNVSGTLSYGEATTKVAFRPLPNESQVGHEVKDKTLRLDIQGTPRDDVSVRAYLLNSDITRGFNLTGYAKKIQAAGTRLAWSGFPGLFVRAGYDRRDIDYKVKNTQTTLNPKVETAWVSARYRPVRQVELSARLTDRKRKDLPNSLFAQSPVTPRDVTRAEWSVSYTPAMTYGLNYRFLQEREKNPYRNMTYRIQLNDLVGWAQLTDRVSVMATYGEHRYKSRFLEDAGLIERGVPYLSDARLWSGGITYTINNRWWVDASYSESKSRRAVRVQEQVVNFSAHVQLKHNAEGILEYTSMDFDDSQNAGNGYDANRVTLWWRQKL